MLCCLPLVLSWPSGFLSSGFQHQGQQVLTLRLSLHHAGPPRPVLPAHSAASMSLGAQEKPGAAAMERRQVAAFRVPIG